MARCCCLGWGLLPLCTGLIMALSVIATYSTATGLHHVDALLPSISDTGAGNPEMHYFSLGLNIVAALAILTFFIRYKAIQCFLDPSEVSHYRPHSLAALILAVIASLGLTLVANFQDNTALVGHLIGAVSLFLVGNIYILVDSALTYRLQPRYGSPAIFVVRLILGIVGLVTFISTFVAYICAQDLTKLTSQEEMHWNKTDPGYHAHLASSFSEWIMGLAFICYFFTYVGEFRQFKVDVKVTLDSPAVKQRMGDVANERTPLLS